MFREPAKRDSHRVATFVALLLSLCASMRVAAQITRDVLTVDTITSTGPAVSVPVYLRDAVSTPLDTGGQKQIQLIAFRVVVSAPGQIAGCSNQTIPQCQMGFEPGSLLQNAKVKSSLVVVTGDSIFVRYSFEPGKGPELSLDAFAPGDTIGALHFVLQSGVAEGTTIGLTLDASAEATFLSDDAASPTIETSANGSLQLDSGAIRVASGCTTAPGGEVSFNVHGSQSGCSGSGCYQKELLTFDAVDFGYTFQDCDVFRWTFSDGVVLTGKTVQHAFDVSGPALRVTVTIDVRNTTGSKASRGSLILQPQPTSCPTMNENNVSVGYSGPQSGCSQNNSVSCNTSELVSLTALGLGYDFSCASHTYTWSFGDGSASDSGKTVSHQFARTGALNVTVTISNGTQTFSVPRIVNVGNGGTTPTPPVPSGSCGTMTNANVFFDWRDTANTCTALGGTCPVNDVLQFTAKSFGYDFGCASHTFAWDFGDGSSASSRNANHIYTTANNYNVTLTINNGTQTFRVTQTVKVGGSASGCIPTCQATVPAVALIGTPVTFALATPFVCGQSVTAVQWDFGDGTSMTTGQAVVVHVYPEAKNYRWTMTTTAGTAPTCVVSGDIAVGYPRRRVTR